MTTSLGEAGGPPSTMRSSEILGLGSKLMPRVRLAVVGDRLCRPGRRTGRSPRLLRGRLDARHVDDRGQERVGEGVAHRVGGVAGRELGHAPDLEVDVLVDGADQRREGVVQGVGQDVGPGDERDAEDDGDGGQRQAELVGEQAFDGDLPHVRPPGSASARGPNPPSARPARPTTVPSARNTTRSA